MIQKTQKMLRKLEFGLLEAIVGIFIAIGLIGYFSTISADLEWLDHTVSFVLFTYLFYQLNITAILFGRTDKKANAIIVIAFFVFFFKDIATYTIRDGHHFEFLTIVDQFYRFLSQNLALMDFATFYVALALLALASVYLTKAIRISHPSLMYAIHQDKLRGRPAKFLAILIALLGFYHLIYSPLLEWLEFSIDDPIIAVGLLFYARSIARHHEKFHPNDFVFKIGDFSLRIYSKFISLFHYKKTLPMAISGLLMLHALSDLGAFAYPLITSQEGFYLDIIGERLSFWHLFLEDRSAVLGYAQPSLAFLYVANIVALIFFLAMPAFIWIRIFSHKEFHVPRMMLSLVFASLLAFALMPAFTMHALSQYSLAGADIQSRHILNGSFFFGLFENESMVVLTASLLAIGIGALVFCLSSNAMIRKELYAITIIASMVFFALYLYYFFSSFADYLLELIATMLLTRHAIIAIVLVLFLMFMAFFYVGGFLCFVYETIMEFHKKKWSEPIDEELVKIIKKIRRKPMMPTSTSKSYS